MILVTTVFDVFFDVFPRKSAKAQNVKKCIWICKIHTILKVGMSKKACSTLTRIDENNDDFLV